MQLHVRAASLGHKPAHADSCCLFSCQLWTAANPRTNTSSSHRPPPPGNAVVASTARNPFWLDVMREGLRRSADPAYAQHENGALRAGHACRSAQTWLNCRT